MITYHWTYKCDYCGTEIQDETEFNYHPYSPIVLPGNIPDVVKNGLWRTLDTMLICPDHVIDVVNNMKPVFADAE